MGSHYLEAHAFQTLAIEKKFLFLDFVHGNGMNLYRHLSNILIFWIAAWRHNASCNTILKVIFNYIYKNNNINLKCNLRNLTQWSSLIKR